VGGPVGYPGKATRWSQPPFKLKKFDFNFLILLQKRYKS